MKNKDKKFFRENIAEELSKQELIDRLCKLNETNHNLQKRYDKIKEVDWDKLYSEFFNLYLHKGIGHKEASIFEWFKSKLK